MIHNLIWIVFFKHDFIEHCAVCLLDAQKLKSSHKKVNASIFSISIFFFIFYYLVQTIDFQ